MDFTKVRHGVFFGFLAFISLAFIIIMKPFAYALFWAAVLAGVFYPVYRWINKRLKLASLSSVITLIFVFILIVIPVTILTSLLVKESIDLYVAVDNNRSQINTTIQNTIEWVKTSPYTSGLNLNEGFWVEKFSEVTKTISSFIFTSLKNLTQNSLTFLALFLVMFYALFFFLRDGERFLRLCMYLCPLGDKYEAMLFKKFASTAKATLKGTIIIGGLQGLLGGIMFAIVGINGAIIWGVIMFILSVIPVTGSGIVWFPAAIAMLVTGNIWQGVFLLVIGFVVISTIDNLLRPILVGKDTQMHPLLVLFSTLGGIVVFGISGFILGPIITSLFVAFWHMYGEYYKKELGRN